MQPQSTPAISRHAAHRISQRGICREALALLIAHGLDAPAGNGSVRREIHKSQARDLCAEGYAPQLVEKAARLEAIVASDETIVTCYIRAARNLRRSSRPAPRTVSRHHRTEARAQ